MTEDSTPVSYGELAAAELAKAREANDEQALAAAEQDTLGRTVTAAEIRAVMADRSISIAEVYARLAAIEAGLPPCCHPLRPAREETP